VADPPLTEESGPAPIARALPGQSSIAVLAFANMTGDVDQEYFSDGIAEDIATQLSYSNALFVIPRNSSFTYKGKAIEVKQIGRELDVRYVLQGSVRRDGAQVGINTQLVDAETGKTVWAERINRAMVDLFEAQDEIAAAVALAIEPEISPVERQRILCKPIVSHRVM
jgi:adenylate cyclase